MAIKLQQHVGFVTKFLNLIHNEFPKHYESFSFVVGSRVNIGGSLCRVRLNTALITQTQKINQRLILNTMGCVGRRVWTIVLSFTTDNWDTFQKTTCEKEVIFECLFKKPGKSPKISPLFAFPTIHPKINMYSIHMSEFLGDSALGFHSGGFKINKKRDKIVMLVRLEESGFYSTL